MGTNNRNELTRFTPNRFTKLNRLSIFIALQWSQQGTRQKSIVKIVFNGILHEKREYLWHRFLTNALLFTFYRVAL